MKHWTLKNGVMVDERGAMFSYGDIVEYFGGVTNADHFLAKLYLGESVSYPSDWDREYMLQHFHVVQRTHIILLNAFLKSKGINW